MDRIRGWKVRTKITREFLNTMLPHKVIETRAESIMNTMRTLGPHTAIIRGVMIAISMKPVERNHMTSHALRTMGNRVPRTMGINEEKNLITLEEMTIGALQDMVSRPARAMDGKHIVLPINKRTIPMDANQITRNRAKGEDINPATKLHRVATMMKAINHVPPVIRKPAINHPLLVTSRRKAIKAVPLAMMKVTNLVPTVMRKKVIKHMKVEATNPVPLVMRRKRAIKGAPTDTRRKTHTRTMMGERTVNGPTIVIERIQKKLMEQND
jgi:hypothetical protein